MEAKEEEKNATLIKVQWLTSMHEQLTVTIINNYKIVKLEA
jgi:hypothetical protein